MQAVQENKAVLIFVNAVFPYEKSECFKALQKWFYKKGKYIGTRFVYTLSFSLLAGEWKGVTFCPLE